MSLKERSAPPSLAVDHVAKEEKTYPSLFALLVVLKVILAQRPISAITPQTA